MTRYTKLYTLGNILALQLRGFSFLKSKRSNQSLFPRRTRSIIQEKLTRPVNKILVLPIYALHLHLAKTILIFLAKGAISRFNCHVNGNS